MYKLFFVIVLCLVLGLIGEIDHKVQTHSHNNYCEMVQTYQETAGKYGWPDYKNTCEVVYE